MTVTKPNRECYDYNAIHYIHVHFEGIQGCREQMNGLKFYELKKEEKIGNFFKKESEIQ